MMKSILFFGECMLEESQSEAFRFGGDTLNTALYLSRATDSSDLDVHYATALGADYDSNLLLSAWNKEQIKTDYVLQLVDRFPGRYSIKTNKSGERSFSYQRNESAARYYISHIPNRFVKALTQKKCDYFYLSGISLAILLPAEREKLFNLLQTYKDQGGKVIFDNNYRPILWKTSEVLPAYESVMALSEIVFLTDEDEHALYPEAQKLSDIIERSQAFGVKEVIVKQGSKPCVIAYQNTIEHVPANALSHEQIIDTCAAGDAFSAGYLAKRLMEESPESSAKFAHQLAARVIQFSGAIIPQKAMLDLMPKVN